MNFSKMQGIYGFKSRANATLWIFGVVFFKRQKGGTIASISVILSSDKNHPIHPPQVFYGSKEKGKPSFRRPWLSGTLPSFPRSASYCTPREWQKPGEGLQWLGREIEFISVSQCTIQNDIYTLCHAPCSSFTLLLCVFFKGRGYTRLFKVTVS